MSALLPNGHRTKLTPLVQRRICQAIRLGASKELACKYAGISEPAFYEWMRKGETYEEQPYFNFYKAVLAAEGKAGLAWLAKIEDAANKGNWQAAAWKLERIYPEKYGRVINEQNHTGTTTIQVEYVNDWRRNAVDANSAADAASRAIGGQAAGQALQLPGGRPTLAQDDAGDDAGD